MSTAPFAIPTLLNAAPVAVHHSSRRHLLVRAWAVVGVALLSFIIGCATIPAQKALYVTQHTVDAGIKTYFGLVVEGKARTNEVPRIAALYNSFQGVYRIALEEAHSDSNAPPSLIVQSAAAEVLSAIAQAKAGGGP